MLIRREFLIAEMKSSLRGHILGIAVCILITISGIGNWNLYVVMFSLIASLLRQDIDARIHANQYGSKSITKLKRNSMPIIVIPSFKRGMLM